jgi:hypothetical protein
MEWIIAGIAFVGGVVFWEFTRNAVLDGIFNGLSKFADLFKKAK